MSLSAEKYRQELITEILMASTEEEVKKFCDTAMKNAAQNKGDGPAIAWFINKLEEDLEGFNPRTKNVQQWSNIQTARSHIGIIKQRLSTLLH